MRLLVAEDDVRLARIVKRGLEGEGHVVDTVRDGDAAFAAGVSDDFDVLVLDVMMPGIDGFEVIRRLRDRGIGTPTLMLTARGELEDRVRGLDHGADDYLVKPFAFEELSARVRALGRRATVHDTRLRAGDLEVDLVRHEVSVSGQIVELSPTEFRLLEALLRGRGRALTRQSLLSRVWGYDDEPESNAVDLYVHYLRRKLGDAVRITTVRGVGYRLDEPEGGEFS
ncbi:MAG: response regulator transcription factor [Dehalococcoidia bacterium]